MKWEDDERSSNIEDRRMQSSSRASFGGAGLSAAVPIARFLMRSKVGRIVLVAGVVAYFFGFNPLALLNGGGGTKTSVKDEAKDNQTAAFISTVLKTTEDSWSKVFAAHGATYKKPTLVLFRGSTQSGCGYASKQTGPFYCPVDQKVYLDLSFFDELKNRHNSPGDFAQAYVVAHEIGHHVQNMIGTLDKVNKKQQAYGRGTIQANALQVKVELQADCYAGVWAHYQDTRGKLEDGDIKEALNAANSIGDDTLQKEAQGYVVPDSFTHGSSKQRMAWFKRGYEGGKLSSCQTGARE